MESTGISNSRWADMGSKLQAAATVLGYDENSWNEKVETKMMGPLQNHRWADLSAEQKSAAKVLGYTAKSWDNEENVLNPPSGVAGSALLPSESPEEEEEAAMEPTGAGDLSKRSTNESASVREQKILAREIRALEIRAHDQTLILHMPHRVKLRTIRPAMARLSEEALKKPLVAPLKRLLKQEFVFPTFVLGTSVVIDIF